MHGCNVAKRCLPSVSQIQTNLTLFNVYTLQHARFQTTPRRSPLYSCTHEFQTSWSLIQIFEFNFTLIMTSHSLLHPHSRHYPSHTCNLFLQVGLPWRHTPTHIPLSIISGILYLSRMHAQRSMFLYVSVYIARCFIVFHTNRSIDISSEVSPYFPRPHRSIYTSLYRINIYS